jgi:hypothetical protein
MRCHRHARASAFTSVPSGWGLVVGVISLPSGATMRLRPQRRRMGMRTISMLPSQPYLESVQPDSAMPRALDGGTPAGLGCQLGRH